MYAPMGHALGLGPVAQQLEDRCFQVRAGWRCASAAREWQSGGRGKDGGAPPFPVRCLEPSWHLE